MEKSSSRLIVYAPNWLGDAVMSLPALAALRATFPRDVIHAAASNQLTDLMSLTTSVDEVLGWSCTDSVLQRAGLIKAGGYRRIILFPNSFRSAWIARLSGIKERWGYAGQMRGWLLSRPVSNHFRLKGGHQSHQYLELIRQMGWRGFGIPKMSLRMPASSPQWIERALGVKLDGRTLVGICPGATYGPAKRWPSERFVEVGRTLVNRHGVQILLMGNEHEAPFIRRMAEEIGTAWDLSGRTDMKGLMAALAQCTVMIANDSGVMHLASILGIPVVALFGSTNPASTAPLGPHRTITKSLKCAPCLRRRCPHGTYQCLRDITSEEVYQAVESFLEEPRLATSPEDESTQHICHRADLQ